MRKLLFVPIITGMFFVSCYFSSSGPEILIKKDFDGKAIAVLNFSRAGSYLPSEIGITAADKLADSFFLVDRFDVINRSNVNKMQLKLGITNTEALSFKDVQDIGAGLNASFLILGQVRNITTQNQFLDSDPEKKLALTFRIISVKTLEVTGVINYTRTYNDENLNDLLTSMITDITEKIRKD